jgi:hypothetical protein
MNKPDNDGWHPDGHRIRQGIPGPEWTRDELDARARWEHQRIDKGETYSPRYWFLGRVLMEVRKDMTLDQWKSWRKSNQLNRTRCDRAQLLARAFEPDKKRPFDAPEELERLPLLRALAVASERLGVKRRRLAIDARLRRWLKLTKTKAELRLAELASVAAPGELRPFIADLTYTLLEFDRACIAEETARCDAAAVSSK